MSDAHPTAFSVQDRPISRCTLSTNTSTPDFSKKTSCSYDAYQLHVPTLLTRLADKIGSSLVSSKAARAGSILRRCQHLQSWFTQPTPRIPRSPDTLAAPGLQVSPLGRQCVYPRTRPNCPRAIGKPDVHSAFEAVPNVILYSFYFLYLYLYTQISHRRQKGS